jgi:hypothetical protein
VGNRSCRLSRPDTSGLDSAIKQGSDLSPYFPERISLKGQALPCLHDEFEVPGPGIGRKRRLSDEPKMNLHKNSLSSDSALLSGGRTYVRLAQRGQIKIICLQLSNLINISIQPGDPIES